MELPRVAGRLLPLFDGDAVEPAERGEEGGHEQEDELVLGGIGRCRGGDSNESRDCSGRSEDDGNDEFLGEPAFDFVSAKMHESKVGGDDGEDEDIGAACGREHVKEDEPGKESTYGDCDCCDGETMAHVEEMPLAEAGGVVAKTIEDAVGDVEKPGSGEEQWKGVGRESETKGARKGEGPKRGDGWSIKREQVPCVDEGEGGSHEEGSRAMRDWQRGVLR